MTVRRPATKKCREMDRPVAGLITDLKARGLLDETLVIWGGEFGRTPFDQDLSLGKAPEANRGREHNPRGFTMWLAGASVKGGLVHGETDDFGFQAVEGKVHIHDLHATILHLLGLDHERLTYRYNGRDFRLTDVYGRVVNEILS
jgi:arylsulfatase A-like enzyme